MKWVAAISFWLILLAILCLAGCPSHTVINDPVVGSGNAIAQSQSLTESAIESVVLAKPHADDVGKAHLTSATSDLDQVLLKLDIAEQDLKAEQKLRATVTAERDKERADRIALQQSWGHWVQVWATRAFILLSLAFLAHIALGEVALFVSGPTGLLLDKISTIVNPLGWYEKLKQARQQAGMVKAAS